jgi:CheY-like chemotaxis protein
MHNLFESQDGPDPQPSSQEEITSFLRNRAIFLLSRKLNEEINTILTGIMGYTSLIMTPNYPAQKKPLHLEQIMQFCESARQTNEIYGRVLSGSKKKHDDQKNREWLIRIIQFFDRIYSSQCTFKLIPTKEGAYSGDTLWGWETMILHLLTESALLICEKGRITIRLCSSTDATIRQTWLQMTINASCLHRKNTENTFKRKIINQYYQTPQWDAATQICASQQGELSLQSHASGYQFILNIPIENESTPLLPPQYAKMNYKKSSNVEIEIVLLEEQELISDFLRILLADEGYSVKVYQNGATLKNQLPSLNIEKINLFILDIFVPGLSGLEVAHFIRDHHPRAKILIYSALTDLESVKKEVELDSYTQFLQKPFKKEELLCMIKWLTSQRMSDE